MPEFQDLLRELTLLAVPLLLAVTFHEAAHGYVADRLGDPTPRAAGRLTLNPIAHLDPVGTLVFVVTRAIGWAKPVPVDPRHFRNPRRGMLWVSLAGPGANLLVATVFALLCRLLVRVPIDEEGWLGVRVLAPLALVSVRGVTLNLGLALFNLLPVPPLDGSQVLAGLLPERAAQAMGVLQRYGFALLLVIVFSGVLDRTLFPALDLMTRVLLGPAGAWLGLS
ncbi:MAG: site-2 protease family protein [Deltaproteobacteria bacterium]|nr:site-2 protease family protein [Deltaproteobacteria bacterium]